MATTASLMAQTGSVIHQAKFVDVNGIRTRYYELGSGEPMVMFHGSEWCGTGNSNVWTRNLGGLSQSFHVYAVDRLGNGMTDNPKDVANNAGHYLFRERPEEWNQVVTNFIQISQ